MTLDDWHQRHWLFGQDDKSCQLKLLGLVTFSCFCTVPNGERASVFERLRIVSLASDAAFQIKCRSAMSWVQQQNFDAGQSGFESVERSWRGQKGLPSWASFRFVLAQKLHPQVSVLSWVVWLVRPDLSSPSASLCLGFRWFGFAQLGGRRMGSSMDEQQKVVAVEHLVLLRFVEFLDTLGSW